MNQRKITLGGVLLAALVVAGCNGGPVAGTPTAPTSSAGAASSDGPGASVAALDSCALLTNTEAASLGLPPGTASQIGSQKTCNYEAIGQRPPITGAVTINPRVGIDSLQAPGNTDEAGIKKTTVDGRRVQYFPGKTGIICTSNIEVNKREHVTVQATLDKANTSEPVCAVVEKMINLILPKMPKK